MNKELTFKVKVDKKADKETQRIQRQFQILQEQVIQMEKEIEEAMIVEAEVLHAIITV